MPFIADKIQTNLYKEPTRRRGFIPDPPEQQEITGTYQKFSGVARPGRGEIYPVQYKKYSDEAIDELVRIGDELATKEKALRQKKIGQPPVEPTKIAKEPKAKLPETKQLPEKPYPPGVAIIPQIPIKETLQVPSMGYEAPTLPPSKMSLGESQETEKWFREIQNVQVSAFGKPPVPLKELVTVGALTGVSFYVSPALGLGIAGALLGPRFLEKTGIKDKLGLSDEDTYALTSTAIAALQGLPTLSRGIHYMITKPAVATVTKQDVVKYVQRAVDIGAIKPEQRQFYEDVLKRITPVTNIYRVPKPEFEKEFIVNMGKDKNLKFGVQSILEGTFGQKYQPLAVKPAEAIPGKPFPPTPGVIVPPVPITAEPFPVPLGEITRITPAIPSKPITPVPTPLVAVTPQIPAVPPVTESIEAGKPIPKELESLAQEARKYKTAEEFVKGKDVVWAGGIGKTGGIERAKANQIIDKYITPALEKLYKDKKIIEDTIEKKTTITQAYKTMPEMHKRWIKNLSDIEKEKNKILADFYTQAVKPIPTELEPLVQEARKYKSAEEFVDNKLIEKMTVSDVQRNNLGWAEFSKERKLKQRTPEKLIINDEEVNSSDFGLIGWNINNPEIYTRIKKEGKIISENKISGVGTITGGNVEEIFYIKNGEPKYAYILYDNQIPDDPQTESIITTKKLNKDEIANIFEALHAKTEENISYQGLEKYYDLLKKEGFPNEHFQLAYHSLLVESDFRDLAVSLAKKEITAKEAIIEARKKQPTWGWTGDSKIAEDVIKNFEVVGSIYLKNRKSQLTDIWNKANQPELAKQVKPKITPPEPTRIPGIVLMKPETIKIAPEEMQLRDTPYAEERVKSILESGWDEALYDIIPVVKRADGYYVAGDGHSRLAAYNALKEAGKPVPQDLEFKVVSEAEAKRLRFANLGRTPLLPLEESKAFNELINQGKSISNIATDFGKSRTYVEKTVLLKNLSDGIKQLIRDKGLPIHHAYVLAKATTDFGLPAGVQMEIFQKWIKIQDITPTTLEMALKKLAPEMTKQLELGLTGLQIFKGFQEPFNDILKEIKVLEQEARAYNGIVSFVNKMQKQKKPVEPGVMNAYNLFKSKVSQVDKKIEDLKKTIGKTKLEFGKIPMVSERKKPYPYYQKTLDNKWELVTPPVKKPVSPEQLTLWSSLAHPKFDLPPQRPIPPVIEAPAPKQLGLLPESAKKDITELLPASEIMKTEDLKMLEVPNLKIETPQDAAAIMSFLKNYRKEKFMVISLDNEDNVINVSMVSVGTLTSAPAHPRETLQVPLQVGAKKIILVHNHPDGDVAASRDDKVSMNKITNVADNIGIDVSESIIINRIEFGYLSKNAETFQRIPYEEPKDRPYKVKLVDTYYHRVSEGIVDKNQIKTTTQCVDIIKKYLDTDKPSIISIFLENNRRILAIDFIADNYDNISAIKSSLSKLAISHASDSMILATNIPGGYDKLRSLIGWSKVAGWGILDVISQEKPVGVGVIEEVLKPKYKSWSTGGKVVQETTGEYKPVGISKDKLIAKIEKQRARIGLEQDRYDSLKIAIGNSDNLKDFSIDDLNKLSKVMTTIKRTSPVDITKLRPPVKPEIPQKTEYVMPAKEEWRDVIPEPTAEQRDMINKLKTQIAIESRNLKLTKEQLKQIKVRETGFESIKNASIEDLGKVLQAVLDEGKKQTWRKFLLDRAEKLGLIYKTKQGNISTVNFKRFTKNYFEKPFEQLSVYELELVNKYMGELQVNRQGMIVSPTMGIGKYSPLEEKYKLGLFKYISQFYEYLRRFDFQKIIRTVEKLIELGKGGTKTTKEIIELAKQSLPMIGNDLRIFDQVGLYYEIGRPLEKAGFDLRKWEAKFDKVIQRWVRVANETKEGREIMFMASNGPFTQEIQGSLTPNQIAVVREWFKWRDFFKKEFGIETGIAHYIHHIIEETVRIWIKQGNPFPEELLAIIEYVIPNQIYADFMEKRTGFPFIKKDFIAATAAYFKMAAKKLSYDKVLEDIKPKLSTLAKRNPKLARYVKDFIQINILGRQTEQAQNLANSLDSIAKFFGEKTIQIPQVIQDIDAELPIELKIRRLTVTPSGINRFISNVKTLNYISVLGLNVRSGLLNLTQSLYALARSRLPLHERAYQFTKSWLTALVKVWSPRQWADARQQGILEEMMRMAEVDNRMKANMQKVTGFAMITMKISEFLNRVSSSKFGGVEKRLLVKRGQLSVFELAKIINSNPKFLEESKYLDKEATDTINFLYGMDYTPTMFISPIGRIFYHLNSFNLKLIDLAVTFAYEVKLGNTIKKFNETVGQDKNGEDYIKFINGLPPQTRANFIMFLMIIAGVGLVFNQTAGLTINPLAKIFIMLAGGNVMGAYNEIWKTFMPFRSAVKRIGRIQQEGVGGIVSIGRIKSAGGYDVSIPQAPAISQIQTPTFSGIP